MSGALWSPDSQCPSKFTSYRYTELYKLFFYLLTNPKSLIFSTHFTSVSARCTKIRTRDTAFQPVSIMKTRHGLMSIMVYEYYEDLTWLWVGRTYQLIWGVCVPVIILRQWDCSVFFTKFVINFLCTFIRTGRHWIKFWISISCETTFVLLVTW